MSEKVVLTQEQADAIREATLIESGNKARVLKFQGMSNCTWRNGCAPLNDLSFEKVARALFIGYEIEKPKFQAGDKVIRKDGLTFAAGEFIWTVVEDQQDSWKAKVVGSGDGWDVFWETASIRHATPEEIFWLHELGRDKVGDFREGDVIVTRNFNHSFLVHSFTEVGKSLSIADANVEWADGNIKGIYPAESFKQF